MRAVWVDEGNGPNWDLLRKHQINWVFMSLLDPNLNQRLNEIRARGLAAGVYAAWNWWPNATGPQFADHVHAELQTRVPDTTPLHPRIQLNDESHDPARIEAMLKRWRQLRPSTATSWTLEGHQGGWWTPSLVRTVIATKTRVVPQCYYGAMVATDPLAAVRDITRRGVPDSMVTPMYAGEALQPYSEGWIFSMGRLKP